MGRSCDKKDQEISKNMFAQPLGSRERGRPRLHWRHEADEDARMFGIKNCWTVVQNHDVWKGFLEEAKTQR